jgi:hypothetical protein
MFKNLFVPTCLIALTVPSVAYAEINEICIGNNYSQGIPLEGVTLPKVTIDSPIRIIDLAGGETVDLSAVAIFDTNQTTNPMYQWCTENKSLLAKLNDNYQQINYTAPYLQQKQIIPVSVTVGDGLGYVDGDTVFIRVAASTDPTFAGDYTISGEINNKQGDPIANATVTVAGRAVLTDENGYYKIEGLIEGEYPLTITKNGYFFKEQKFFVGANVPDIAVNIDAPVSDLAIEIIQTPKSAKLGETIKITNKGNQTATDNQVVYTLPSNTTLLEIITDTASCQYDDVATINCDLNDIAAGESQLININLRPEKSGRLVSEASSSSQQYPDDSYTLKTTIIPYFGLKTWVNPTTLDIDTNFIYHLKLTNTEFSPAIASNAKLVVTLPEGIAYISHKLEGGNCEQTANEITCHLNDIVEASELNIEMTLKGINKGQHRISAELIADEPFTEPVKHSKKVTVISSQEYGESDVLLVIDNTGSMDNDMLAAKQALTEFINELEKFAKKAPRVTLITFKDTVKHRITTNDMQLILNEINKLSASGGAQCPEASIEALEESLNHLKKSGKIILMSDASPHPETDTDGVLRLMMKKSVQFNVLLSGECKEAVNLNKTPKMRQRIAKSSPTKQCDTTTNEQVVSSQAVFSCMTEQTKGVFSYNPEIKLGTEKAQIDLKDKILRILRSATPAPVLVQDENQPIIEEPSSPPISDGNDCILENSTIKNDCDNSNGQLHNVKFDDNIRVSGNGTLSGTISGNANAPAVLESGHILANTSLSNIIINKGVNIDKEAILEQGIQFENNDAIPNDINLSHILSSFIPANINKNQPPLKILDLSNDVLVDSTQSLLEQINSLDSFTENNWIVTQNTETGYLELNLD